MNLQDRPEVRHRCDQASPDSLSTAEYFAGTVADVSRADFRRSLGNGGRPGLGTAFGSPWPALRTSSQKKSVGSWETPLSCWESQRRVHGNIPDRLIGRIGRMATGIPVRAIPMIVELSASRGTTVTSCRNSRTMPEESQSLQAVRTSMKLPQDQKNNRNPATIPAKAREGERFDKGDRATVRAIGQVKWNASPRAFSSGVAAAARTIRMRHMMGTNGK